MGKTNAYSRDNIQSSTGVLDLHMSWLNQPLKTTSSPTFQQISTTGDLIVGGNLTVHGSQTIVDSTIVQIKDNIILINAEETGSGVSLNLAGIEVDRGTQTDFQAVYQESTQLYKIGFVGSLQAVATREDSPLNKGVMVYNNVLGRLDSTTTIQLPITFSSGISSTSSSSGSVIVSGGIGISGNAVIDNKLYLKGNNYTNYLNSDSSNNLIINSGNNVLFQLSSGTSIEIPTNVSMTFGSSANQYIISDNTNITIGNTTGNINLTTSNSIIVPSGTFIQWAFGDSIGYNGTNMVLSSTGNLNINSPIVSTSNVSSTSSSTGSVLVSGSIAISNTTDSISSSNGGTFTTAGGIAVNKSIYVGNKIVIADINLTLSQSSRIGINLRSLNRTLTTTSTNDTVFNSFEGGVINLNSGNMNHASTVYISGSPSTSGVGNLINSYSLWIGSGISQFDGQIICTNNTNSINTTTGSVLLSGGISISSTTDANSSSSGGTFTTGGGIAVKKSMYIANTLNIGDTPLSFNHTQYQGTNFRSMNRILTSTSTDNLMINTFEGGSIITNNTLSNASTVYIQGPPTVTSGTGSITTSYSLWVSGGNTRIDNSLILGGTTASTSPSTGVIVLQGGIGITNTTDASSISNGGTFTTAGGVSVAKTLYVGNNINCNSNYNLNNSGVSRFSIGLIDSESGSNTGSNFSISSYTDAGASLQSNLFTIQRSSGNINISNSLTIAGDLTITGSTVSINTTSLLIQDNFAVVNSAPSGLSDAGYLMRRYQTPNNSNTGTVISGSPKITSTFSSNSTIPGTLVLNSSSSSINNYYTGWWIKITSGTGVNQVRRIKSYTGSTKTALIYVTSDNTSTFSDGLDLINLSNSGDSYSLYDSGYTCMYYSENLNEIRLAYIPYSITSGILNSPTTYLPLHVNNLITESGITTGGNTIINGTLTVNVNDVNSLVVSSTSGTVFDVDSVNGNIIVANPVNTISSHVDILFKQNNSSNTVSTYSQISSVIINNVSGNLRNNLIFSVQKDTSGLTNYFTLSGNISGSGFADFSSNVDSVRILNTTSSSSTSTGALLISGGMSISNTTNASSISNGGSFTTAGGLSVAQSVYIGNTLTITGTTQLNDTSNTVNNSSGTLNLQGDLVLYNSTKNTIVFSQTGATPPSFTTRSIGTKIVLYPNITSSSSDYAFGIEGAALWYSVPSTSQSHKFYLSDQSRFEIDNVGVLLTAGTSNLFTFRMNTSVSSDTQGIILEGGGGNTSARGAILKLYGSQLNSGNAILSAGNAGQVNLQTGNSVNYLTILSTGQTEILSTEETTSNTTGALRVSGGISVNKSVIMGTTTGSTVSFDFNQRYTYSGDTLGNLNVQSQQTTVASTQKYFTFDGDNTTNNNLDIYGLGVPSSLTNSEYLRIGFSPTIYNIMTQSSGTGSVRQLNLQTGSNTGQLLLLTNGNVSLSSTTNSTSITTGALKLSGGIAINSTTNASSSTNGGSFTTGGGAAIAQDVYIGGNLNVSGSLSVGVSTPVFTFSNLVNITGSVTNANSKLIQNGTQCILSTIFSITPTTNGLLSSFRFTIPNVTTNFSNVYDIIVTSSGYNNVSDPVNLENVIGYAITGSTTGKIKFTANGTDTHIIQIIVRYTSG